MSLLVNFVAIENKVDITNKDEYIEGVYNRILKSGLIDSLVVTPSELGTVLNPVKQIDNEDNIFMFDFIGKENGIQYTMQISFEFKTYKVTKQLDISIVSDNYQVDSKKNYLEKLKLEVKKSIIKDWKEIIWLVDRDSECLSIELYPQLYKTENLFRELINQVMNMQYGTSWWDMMVPYKLKAKHRERLKDYKTKVPAFNNVDDRLMSIDIDDLATIITTIRYKWNPTFTDEISSLISGVQKCNDSKVRELLEKQRIEEVNLWKDQFSRYLPVDFVERINRFAKDRNHIMHNKLIDRSAAGMIKANATAIEIDLNKAIEKLGKTILSEEEIKKIEVQKQIEYEMLKELDHDCRENDANVLIRSTEDIKYLFEDSLLEIISSVEDEFRFRNDIEINTKDAYSGKYSGEILGVKSKIDGNELWFRFSMDINDEEGSTSEMTIACDTDGTHFCTEVVYTNGKVEYDSDNGLYMPITQDEISDYNDAKEEIVECIEEIFIDYKENADYGDIAEFVSCAECGEDFICINPDLFPIGTCLNCGYENSIYQCVKCEEWFNPEIDGEYNEEDEFAMCQNCLDAIEEE